MGGLHDLSVLLNRGDGTFADAASRSGLLTVSSFTLADLNGDGSSDIAVDTGSDVDALLNRGDGTFADGGINSSVGDGQIAIADLDGNGTSDLVVNLNSGGIVLLMNGGDATFNAGRYLAAGGAMALSDLNGDGKPDLVVASNYEGVAVILNDGDGTFWRPRPSLPRSVARWRSPIGWDGTLDLAVSTDQGVTVAMGDGRGGLMKPVDYSLAWGRALVAIGDLNGDGEPDLALPMFGGGAGSTVAVLLNEGRGAFGAPVEYAAGTAPVEIAMGDLDGDGRLDLAVENAGRTVGKSIEGAGVSVLLNRGDGSFSASVTYEAGLPAIGDLNGDGKADLVILRAVNGSGVASVWLNQGGGTFPPL